MGKSWTDLDCAGSGWAWLAGAGLGWAALAGTCLAWTSSSSARHRSTTARANTSTSM